MRRICEYNSKIKALEEQNETLKKELLLSRKKRVEASNNAEKLAEENFYLENCLCEVCVEIHELRRENQDLMLQQRKSTSRS